MRSKGRGISGGSGAQGGGQSQNTSNNNSGGGGRDFRTYGGGQNNNHANQGGRRDRFAQGYAQGDQRQNFRNGHRGRINRFRGSNFTKFRDSPQNSFRDRNQHMCEFHKNNDNDESQKELAPQQSTETLPESAPTITEIPAETMASNPPNKENLILNIKKEKNTDYDKPKAKESSSPSSSSSDSEDSMVKSLDKTVKQTIKQENSNGIKAPATQPTVKVKKEPNSKNGKSSSSSSSSSSDDSSSSDEEVEKSKKVSEEDVICLGNVENIEDLVDEPTPTITKCLLCEKIGHISFHCMMICKNCNGKYHGLKDCPKPANLSIVLSSFMEFCLKQSYKYNPTLGFTAATNEQCIAPTFLPSVSSCTTPSLPGYMSNDNLKRKKSRSGTPRSIRKRLSTSTSSTSSESDSESTKSRRRKHRKTSSKDQVGLQPFANVLPYPATFNQPFGFNQPGVVNPLLALSQMMGFNPAMGYAAHPAKE